MDIQVHDAHRFPHRFNPKRISPKHIIIELSKIRENFENRKKKSHFIQWKCRGPPPSPQLPPIKAISRLLKRKLDKIFKVLKEKNKTANQEYLTKLSFRNERERERDTFPRKQKLRIHFNKESCKDSYLTRNLQ